MKKIKKFVSGAVVAGTAFLGLPMPVSAQSWLPTQGPETDNLNELIRIGLNTAVIIAAIVAVVFLIMNGFKYMASGGDAQKTETAQKGLANALIGLIICVAAAIVVHFVLNRLGMEPEDL